MKVEAVHIQTVNISKMVGIHRANALLLPSNMMSHKGFQLAYLDLMLDHSKGQAQGQATA